MGSYGDGLYGASLYGGSAIATSVQPVFPPRVLITLAGLIADDISTITIYRQIGTDRFPLRGAINLNTVAVDTIVRVDGEQPFGVAYNYVAVLADSLGTISEAYSDPLTVTLGARYVISDAITATGAMVAAETWPDHKSTRDSTTFNVGGRAVVVSGPRMAPASTLRLRTDTADDGDAMDALLDTATSGVVLVREEFNLAGFAAYLAILTDSDDRQWWSPVRWWTLDVQETESWPANLEARGFTLGDINTAYLAGSLNDIRNDFATLLLIAQANF
jgi:hypothetical protein